MNCKELISIIVPVYKTEAFLSRCIDSLINQSYNNVEIILVDDSSPDNCPQICDLYAKKDYRIKVIHQENTGVSGARNTGINIAKGKYIMFVDSDDELCFNAIEILLKDALSNDADIVSANAKFVDENGIVTTQSDDETFEIMRGHDSLLASLRGDRDTEAVWAKLFNSRLLADIRFEEGRNINEDGYFMFQCYTKEPVVVRHNVSVYKYTIRTDSCSRQVFSDKYLSMLYFMNEKKKYLDRHCPQYYFQTNNMVVRTHLYFLDVLCSGKGAKCRKLQRQCVKVVRKLSTFFVPTSNHHKLLFSVVILRLYPLYKLAINLKRRLQL